MKFKALPTKQDKVPSSKKTRVSFQMPGLARDHTSSSRRSPGALPFEQGRLPRHMGFDRGLLCGMFRPRWPAPCSATGHA